MFDEASSGTAAHFIGFDGALFGFDGASLRVVGRSTANGQNERLLSI